MTPELLDSDLDALKAMDAIDGHAVAKEIMRLWDTDYGRASRCGPWLRLVTGGWSENESILSHLPPLFTFFYGYSWKRGGLHVYRIPAKRKGKR